MAKNYDQKYIKKVVGWLDQHEKEMFNDQKACKKINK